MNKSKRRTILFWQIISVILLFMTAPSKAEVCSVDNWCWSNPLPQGNRTYSIWGTSDSDVYAVAEYGMIVHYDGSVWSAMDSGTTETLKGIWGTNSSDIFAVGIKGTILHYDGTSWASMDSGISGSTQHLNDVWGTSSSDVYAVGTDGMILHYDGSSWSAMPSGSTKQMLGVCRI